jgi:hypothetical protein
MLYEELEMKRKLCDLENAAAEHESDIQKAKETLAGLENLVFQTVEELKEREAKLTASTDVYSEVNCLVSYNLREQILELTDELRKMWARLNVFYDALLDVRNKASECFVESAGLETYRVIYDMAQEALDKVVENGKLRDDDDACEYFEMADEEVKE